jgi:threonine/homoserine/homoserine lactone efflux protein
MPIGALITFALVGIFTPGPNNIMAMNNARRMGFRKSRSFILGVGSGFFLVMLSCALFHLTLGRMLPGIQPILGAIGALYMLYLAFKPFFFTKNTEKKASSKSIDEHFYLSGLFLQFLNAKVILFGIAVMSGFILPFYSSPLALALISLALTLVNLASASSWALFGAIFQRYFSEHETMSDFV